MKILHLNIHMHALLRYRSVQASAVDMFTLRRLKFSTCIPATESEIMRYKSSTIRICISLCGHSVYNRTISTFFQK